MSTQIDRLTLQLIVRCTNEAGAERIAEKLIGHGRASALAETRHAVAAIPDLDIQGTAWIQTEHVLEMLSAPSQEGA